VSPRGTAPKLSYGAEGQRRNRLREDGYRDGYEGRERQSREPEYLTSYRRGREAKERE